MNKGQKFLTFMIMLFTIPFLLWLFALIKFHGLPKQRTLEYIGYAFNQTVHFQDWRLFLVLVLAIPLTVLLAYVFDLFDDNHFRGQKYKKFLRGTQILSINKLKDKTKERGKEQITVAGCPIPTSVETIHILLNGSTGTGKSVTITEIVEGAIKRGDRVIVLDPNGDLFSKFAKKGDILLNPFDERSVGWSIFNEIRRDFDFTLFAQSIVPKSSGESEQWNSYARILLRSVMKQVRDNLGVKANMKTVKAFATDADVKELKGYLVSTDASSMFVGGADKALGSARFTLSDRLPPQLLMPEGDFSIRKFLEDEKGGNLYVTWREDQAPALRPLLSSWADIFCSGILSLPPSNTRKIWLLLDELSSLDALPSLRSALEKGRKHGLRIVAGLQSVAQLRLLYGKDQAQVIMSNFRSLVVLGGSKTDAETAEMMSLALGEHEVLREQVNRTSGKNASKSRSESAQRERVVLPAEISGLPNLTAYISFGGDYPIARATLKPVDHPIKNKPFVEKAGEKIG